MNEYLKTLWWDRFDVNLYLLVLAAKAKKEQLV